MAGALSTADNEDVFDVGIEQKIPIREAILLGFQNAFVMTGVFVFPGIMGRAFHLPADVTAHLYGMTFIGTGLTTLLMVLFTRMPLPAGPYAGVFSAIMAYGHLPGASLGSAFGSLLVASLAWCLLSIPIRGHSGVSLLTKLIKHPAMMGMIVMIMTMQLANLTLPNWIGTPGDPAFPIVNVVAGLVAVIVLIGFAASGRPLLRRTALLVALAAGSVVFGVFQPVNLAVVATAPWFIAPTLFPLGFGIDPEFALILFVILIAINIQTVTLMGVVGAWAKEDQSEARLSRGVLAMMIGSAIGACMGSISNLPYPANVAILRATRVASRYVTIATALILIAMGFCSKIDYMFVILPSSVLSAAATVLFGTVFVHGVQSLSRVEWNERNLVITGFSLMLAFGSLFIEPETLKQLPLFVNLVLRQPIIVGVVSLVLLGWILPRGAKSAGAGGGH